MPVESQADAALDQKENKRCANQIAPEAKRAKSQKAVTSNLVQEKIDAVCAALAEAGPSAPGASCRQMLLAIAPATLETPGNERHQYQEMWATMLDEVFDAEAKRARELVASAQAKVNAVGEEGARRVATVEQIDAELRAKQDEVKVKQGLLVQAVAAFRAAETALSVASVEKDRLDTAQGQIMEKRRVYLEAKEGDFKILTEGSWEDESAFKQCLDRLSALLKKQKLVDASLLKALHSALIKRPSERGDFDTMVVKQLEGDLDKHLAALDKQIKEGDAAIAEHARTSDSEQAALATAADKKKVAVEDFMARNAERKELQAQLSSATQAVDNHQSSVEEAAELHQSENAALVHIEDIQGKLTFLRDHRAEAEGAVDPSVEEPGNC